MTRIVCLLKPIVAASTDFARFRLVTSTLCAPTRSLENTPERTESIVESNMSLVVSRGSAATLRCDPTCCPRLSQRLSLFRRWCNGQKSAQRNVVPTMQVVAHNSSSRPEAAMQEEEQQQQQQQAAIINRRTAACLAVSAWLGCTVCLMLVVPFAVAGARRVWSFVEHLRSMGIAGEAATWVKFVALLATAMGIVWTVFQCWMSLQQTVAAVDQLGKEVQQQQENLRAESQQQRAEIQQQQEKLIAETQQQQDQLSAKLDSLFASTLLKHVDKLDERVSRMEDHRGLFGR